MTTDGDIEGAADTAAEAPTDGGPGPEAVEAVEAPQEAAEGARKRARRAPGPRSVRRPSARANAPRLRVLAWTWLRRASEVMQAARPATVSGAATQPEHDVARAHLKGLLEALIFASDRPMPANELARSAKANRALVKELLAEMVGEYRERGFRLEEVAGGFAFRTSAAFAPFVRDLALKKPVRMSRAQIETLAIVAYRQPITRPEIDDVRGVDSGPVLKTLLERDLVRILGKKDEPGRPMLYGTTAGFLEFFGLRALGDLPTLREFTELSDESRRTYERELGEEPPEGAVGEGFAGGEGGISATVGASDDLGAEERAAGGDASEAAGGGDDEGAGEAPGSGTDAEADERSDDAESDSDDSEDAESASDDAESASDDADDADDEDDEDDEDDDEDDDDDDEDDDD